MTSDQQTERVVQGDDDIQRDYEGAVVPCPVCDADPDMDWTPKIALKSGSCYECKTDFSVTVTWHIEENHD